MAEYTYKQWGDEQSDENVIHADDCYRWQAGVEAAGGTWDGEWIDDDRTGKGLITIQQFNDLEQEIANLYGSGFTPKKYDPDSTVQIVPGPAEWNRIEDAINTILNRTAFAIYCETDNSLTFYVDTEVPEVGDTYEGKTVTSIWADFINSVWSSADACPWYGLSKTIGSVTIDRSFSLCKPTSMTRWFVGMNYITAITGLEYIDTSKVTNMTSLFNACNALLSIDALTNWDISSATNLSYMFCNCSGLTSVDEITTKWDFSNVTDIAQMFNLCSELTTVDLSKLDSSKVTRMEYMFASCTALTTIYSDDDVFVTTAVTNSTGMFNGCRALVGGNGTTFDSSKTDASMAHIDTADNPGYFTAKG